MDEIKQMLEDWREEQTQRQEKMLCDLKLINMALELIVKRTCDSDEESDSREV